MLEGCSGDRWLSGFDHSPMSSLNPVKIKGIEELGAFGQMSPPVDISSGQHSRKRAMLPNGNPLQHSCLENPVDRGAWWAAVHGVSRSQTELKRLSMHACIGEGNGNPLQYFCLKNPRDRGAWWAAIYGVIQSRTQLKQLSSSSSLLNESQKGSPVREKTASLSIFFCLDWIMKR